MANRMIRLLGVVVLAMLPALPALAQEAELGGELRPRFELRDPVAGGGTVEFTSMRTRASLTVALDRSITVFAQLQDVRLFGEEASTLADYSADGLDVHQAWLELGEAAEDRWSFRVGRQEAAYGGERLVGSVNWTQQGRAFDGARVRFRPSSDLVVDGMAFRIADSDAPAVTSDHSVYGIYSTLEAAGSLDLFGLLDLEETQLTQTDLFTVGARWVSSRDAVTWRAAASRDTFTASPYPGDSLEGAYQAGEAQQPLGTVIDRSAFMLGARVGASLTDELTGTLWYDYLSGDDDPTDDTSRVFDTLYATNHKFYGYMDLFLDIPAATNGRGLQDVAVKTEYDLGEGRSLGADLHVFAVAAGDGLETSRIGEELDLTYRWSYAPGVAFTGGFSYFRAAEAWSTALGNPDDNQVWGYVMLDVVF